MAQAIFIAPENVYKPRCYTAEIEQFSRTLPVEKDNFLSSFFFQQIQNFISKYSEYFSRKKEKLYQKKSNFHLFLFNSIKLPFKNEL